MNDSDFEEIVERLQHTVQSNPSDPHSKKAKEIIEKLGIDTSRLL